jgi:hypothetical protein
MVGLLSKEGRTEPTEPRSRLLALFRARKRLTFGPPEPGKHEELERKLEANMAEIDAELDKMLEARKLRN